MLSERGTTTLALTELQRRELALSEANRVLFPILGGARRLLQVAELARLHITRTKVYSTTDKRVHIVLLDIFSHNPLIIALYVSTQESRATSPSQLLRRVRRLAREVEKLRESEFISADTLYLYITRRRITRGAYREARARGILVALSSKEARRRIARYLLARLNKLLQKITSKHIWGRLALFAYALSVLAKKLGAEINEPSIITIVKAYELGIDVHSLQEILKPPLRT